MYMWTAGISLKKQFSYTVWNTIRAENHTHYVLCMLTDWMTSPTFLLKRYQSLAGPHL